jgi:hypothetical protein
MASKCTIIDHCYSPQKAEEQAPQLENLMKMLNPQMNMRLPLPRKQGNRSMSVTPNYNPYDSVRGGGGYDFA